MVASGPCPFFYWLGDCWRGNIRVRCFVFVGVNDHGDSIGLQLGNESLQNWINQIKLSTAPSIIPDIVSHVVRGKTIVEICVSEYPVKPVSCKGKVTTYMVPHMHTIRLTYV